MREIRWAEIVFLIPLVVIHEKWLAVGAQESFDFRLTICVRTQHGEFLKIGCFDDVVVFDW